MQVKTVNFHGNPHFRYLPLPKFSLRETTLKYSETSQLRTSQIAGMPWIADKMFSPKYESMSSYLPIADTSQ